MTSGSNVTGGPGCCSGNGSPGRSLARGSGALSSGAADQPLDRTDPGDRPEAKSRGASLHHDLSIETQHLSREECRPSTATVAVPLTPERESGQLEAVRLSAAARPRPGRVWRRRSPRLRSWARHRSARRSPCSRRRPGPTRSSRASSTESPRSGSALEPLGGGDHALHLTRRGSERLEGLAVVAQALERRPELPRSQPERVGARLGRARSFAEDLERLIPGRALCARGEAEDRGSAGAARVYALVEAARALVRLLDRAAEFGREVRGIAVGSGGPVSQAGRLESIPNAGPSAAMRRSMTDPPLPRWSV